MTWKSYMQAIQEYLDKAKNLGFRGYDQVITTYQQSNLRSSDYYDKRYMLTDGVHTMPLEF